jgi:hypothetical protein
MKINARVAAIFSIVVAIGFAAAYFDEETILPESGSQTDTPPIETAASISSLNTSQVRREEKLFEKNKEANSYNQKVASRIIKLVEKLAVMESNSTLLSASAITTPFVRLDREQRLQVYVHLFQVNDPMVAELRAQGFDVELVNDSLKLVQGWIHFKQISMLAYNSNVARVDLPKYAHRSQGSRTTEGDRILLANRLREMGYSGSGVRIGIISDGATDMAGAIATGDLPSDVQRLGSCTKRSANRSQCLSQRTCNEGTAMGEIVHDIAPNAKLAIAAVGTSLEFVQRVNELVTSFGANVIVDDLGFLSEPYFEDGDLAAAVKSIADDVVYVSSAGNAAEDHYEAEFRSYAVPLDDGTNAFLHNFSTSSLDDYSLNVQLAPDGYVIAFLQWNDRFGSSANDYDLVLTNDAETEFLAESQFPQDGFSDPLEAVCYHNSSLSTKIAKLGVRKFSGLNRRLEMFIFGRDMAKEYNVSSGSIFGHPGVASVISVAAINADNQNNVASYSSNGPSRIDYPSRVNRLKPDVAAIDGVSVTGTGGFPSTFYGTSAAAPHVAAIAGLLLEADPIASPRAIKDALMSGAVDVAASGFDQVAGAGRVDAVAALSYLSVALDSDGDGVLDDADAFPNDPTETTDTDGDGIGNVRDTDDDNDGVIDISDAFPLDPTESSDSDGDGVGDNQDTDSNSLYLGRAYYMTASTSPNLSEVHIINTSASALSFTGTLFNKSGSQLGASNVALHEGLIAPQGRLVLSSTDLEQRFNELPWKGPAMLDVRASNQFELMSKLSRNGRVTNTNCVRTDNVHNVEGTDSPDVSYIRFVNGGVTSLANIRGTLYDSDGNPVGQQNVQFFESLGPREAVFLSRDSISNVIGATWTGVASLALSATYENLKLTNLNFVNDETFFNFSCYEKAIDQSAR